MCSCTLFHPPFLQCPPPPSFLFRRGAVAIETRGFDPPAKQSGKNRKCGREIFCSRGSHFESFCCTPSPTSGVICPPPRGISLALAVAHIGVLNCGWEW
ncbi:hypothetical protein CDAR_550921 [Caerostris darwini]|uniref:Uncharacterized protein n=1 Tax=Caerostris darwini TaxID=1538125 RepID=A0AAV4QLA0_9ARAC|nr:hypothetical protein CDAR_550921 [Caerostris darwini]